MNLNWSHLDIIKAPELNVSSCLHYQPTMVPLSRVITCNAADHCVFVSGGGLAGWWLHDCSSGCVETVVTVPLSVDSAPTAVWWAGLRCQPRFELGVGDKGSVTSGLSHHQCVSWFWSSASVWWREAHGNPGFLLAGRLLTPRLCSTS